jgi:hypothetical protein
MATPRRLRFVHAQVAWMLATILLLAALGAVSAELFFVVSLIGFLVVIELTAPRSVVPTWRSRLKWLVAFGLFGFGIVVVNRILAILPFGPSSLFDLLPLLVSVEVAC